MNYTRKGPKYVMSGESVRKGSSAGVYIDLAKFSKLLKKFEGSRQEFAETIGRSDSWVGNVLNRGTMAKVDALALKAIYKVDLIIDKPVEEKPEVKQSENVVVTANNAEILAKMNELLTAINRLGNVNMQLLEDLHKITKELVK